MCKHLRLFMHSVILLDMVFMRWLISSWVFHSKLTQLHERLLKSMKGATNNLQLIMSQTCPIGERFGDLGGHATSYTDFTIQKWPHNLEDWMLLSFFLRWKTKIPQIFALNLNCYKHLTKRLKYNDYTEIITY